MSSNVDKPPPWEDKFKLPPIWKWDNYDGCPQPDSYHEECKRCGKFGWINFGFTTCDNQFCRTGIRPPPPPPITVNNGEVKEVPEQKPDVLRVGCQGCRKTLKSEDPNCRLVGTCEHILCVGCCNKSISKAISVRCQTISCPICEKAFKITELVKIKLTLV